MCGICGVVQIRGEARPEVIEAWRLDRMTDAMRHRGPNDRGTYMSTGVALGVRRLSIVDVAHGHQPLSNETGDIWAIQNGELYNHTDLRQSLEDDGHAFRTNCDTEVLPHCYERYGTEVASRLRGKFAIALWDERRRRAVIARDRLGVKPLYYSVAGDTLLFASELKAILASGLVSTDLDLDAIDAFLTLGFIPGPRTPLASVSKLLPGHLLVVQDGTVRNERYWRYPPPSVSRERLSRQEYGERLLEGLDEAVRLRLMSDVPLGAMLSGGIDSSLIVALMARHMSDPVKTFSVGFAEDRDGNELADARMVAEQFGADHHELELSFARDTVDLEDLVWYLDEPLADLSSLGFIALSELAARHVTVALSGQGADELLGGYQKHRAAAIVAMWNRVPRFGRMVGHRILAYGPPRARRAARTLAAEDPVERLVAMSGRMTSSLRERLFSGALAERAGREARRAISDRLDGVGNSPLGATLFLDAQLALVDDMLHYFDRASMAHSLEVRVPFLDHELVEYCATIPPDLKVRRLQTKYILKDVARGVIPDRIIDKRKVGFFSGAVDGWFKSQAERAVADYLLQPAPKYSEFLDKGEVERLIRQHAKGPADKDVQLLLSILMLEVWLTTFVPRARSASDSRERAAAAVG
jgi:asparagine synthase (glutamine-hydrolysing)